MSNERVEKARQLVEQFPTNDLARFNLAQSCCDAGLQQEALEQLRVLAEKRRDWMVVQILLGKCLLAAGQREEARKTLETAHQLAIEQHHDSPRDEIAGLLEHL